MSSRHQSEEEAISLKVSVEGFKKDSSRLHLSSAPDRLNKQTVAGTLSPSPTVPFSPVFQVEWFF
jgi:hypothetical protein